MPYSGFTASSDITEWHRSSGAGRRRSCRSPGGSARPCRKEEVARR